MAATVACVTGPSLNAKFSRPRLGGGVPSAVGGVALVHLGPGAQEMHIRGVETLRHSQWDYGVLVHLEERLQLQHLPTVAPYFCRLFGRGLAVASSSSSSLLGPAGKSGWGRAQVRTLAV